MNKRYRIEKYDQNTSCYFASKIGKDEYAYLVYDYTHEELPFLVCITPDQVAAETAAIALNLLDMVRRLGV